LVIGRLDHGDERKVIHEEDIAGALRSARVGGSANEWRVNLQTLGVLAPDGRLDREAAVSVRRALELAGDSFDPVGRPPSWTPVATLPPEVRSLLQPPPLRQTAGVMLEMIDRSTELIRLAAPFVDSPAVRSLAESLQAARRRGVDINVITSAGRGIEFATLSEGCDGGARGGLRVTEVRTELSSLGSHAKVLVVDDLCAYVGSANLTTAGLGRHVEIGVEAAGPQVEDLARLLVALERLGTCVMNVGRT
jgi:phosphatidylserine/phosphatidylglycerophosphate/cardiolipin synthase-like enzyme